MFSFGTKSVLNSTCKKTLLILIFWVIKICSHTEIYNLYWIHWENNWSYKNDKKNFKSITVKFKFSVAGEWKSYM